MTRQLLTPRWLLLHALFLVAAVATGFLAVWQWDRAHEAGGSFQNLGYALQWPLFGVFTLFLWGWLIRMELQHGDTAGPAGLPQHDTEPARAEQPAPEQRPEVNTTTSRRRPLVPPPAPPVDADEDPELAAYNRYLAELDEAHRRDEGGEPATGEDSGSGEESATGEAATTGDSPQTGQARSS